MKKIVIDMQRVTHMNSTGLGAIVASLTSARNRQGDVRIAGTNEKVGPLAMFGFCNSLCSFSQSIAWRVQ